MRQSIALQNPVMTSDGQGGYSTTWSTAATIAATVVEKTSSEFVDGKRLAGSVKYDITMRYRADIGYDSRISYSGRTLNIYSIIDPDSTKRYLELKGRDGVAT